MKRAAPSTDLCTFRRCGVLATRRLAQSTGGAPWFGCDTHWPSMEKALYVGMPGATTGTAWVEVSEL